MKKNNLDLQITKRIVAAGIWITFSEFFRNEVLLKEHWIEHYRKLGLLFQTQPTNGILWIFWSFLLAISLCLLLKRLSRFEAGVVSWVMSFLLMWITLYNLQVLPGSILFFALPLSLLEVFIAIKILKP